MEILALAIGKDSDNYAIVSWGVAETLIRSDNSALNRTNWASMHS